MISTCVCQFFIHEKRRPARWKRGEKIAGRRLRKPRAAAARNSDSGNFWRKLSDYLIESEARALLTRATSALRATGGQSNKRAAAGHVNHFLSALCAAADVSCSASNRWQVSRARAQAAAAANGSLGPANRSSPVARAIHSPPSFLPPLASSRRRRRRAAAIEKRPPLSGPLARILRNCSL